jgi:signal peptidase II
MKKIFIISFIVLLIDFISKRLIISSLLVDESIRVIDKFFSITYVRNTGVAFSLFDGHVDLIVIINLIIILLMFKYLSNNGINNKIEKFSYGFIFGGAVGNLIDRIIYGYVVDFLDFNLFGYSAPIFNFADTFIVIGVIMFFVFSREVGDKDGISSKR